MTILLEIFSNRAIQAGFVGWAAAQIMKVILTFLINKKFDHTRLTGSGGMPSSHSSMSCALVTCIGFHEGFSSPLFAIAFCFAAVVMYDAAGVRRSTGKNAAVLNRMIESMSANGFAYDEEKLKELVGHTPIQVLAGALLGILIGTIMS